MPELKRRFPLCMFAVDLLRRPEYRQADCDAPAPSCLFRFHRELSDLRVTVTTSSPSTSFTLIKRVRALEAGAWQTLSRLYGPLVYRWARQSGLQAQDAADVMQNVFMSVLRGIQRFSMDEPHATFRGWLWTITRNAVREFARRQVQLPRPTGGSAAQIVLQQYPDIMEDASEPTDHEAEASLIHRALRIVQESVEPHNWEAFWRTTALAESSVDVAEALQMSPTAVRQAKYRILCRLRDLLVDE